MQYSLGNIGPLLLAASQLLAEGPSSLLGSLLGSYLASTLAAMSAITKMGSQLAESGKTGC